MLSTSYFSHFFVMFFLFVLPKKCWTVASNGQTISLYPEAHAVWRKIFFFYWNESLRNLFWDKWKERTQNARNCPYWECRFYSRFVYIIPEVLVLLLLFVVNYVSPLFWLFLLLSPQLSVLFPLLIIFLPLHKMLQKRKLLSLRNRWEENYVLPICMIRHCLWLYLLWMRQITAGPE